MLVGGGHSHVQLLRMAAMKPFAARITLVVDWPVAVYSGMVPGFVAGQYSLDELQIDTRPLARRAGIAVVEARATGISGDSVLLEGRPPLAFDVASINIGSTVAGLDTPGVVEHALATRPINRFVERLEIEGEGPVVVVGAGAGGVELAACIRTRTGRAVHLVSSKILPGRGEAFAASVERELRQRGVTIHAGVRATEVGETDVLLDSGERIDSSLTVWVTGASGVPFGGVPTDDRGFVLVEDSLLVAGRENVFAVGDCAVLKSWPQIPKAGVYAVREGPVLARNVRSLLKGEGLSDYRPQHDFFSLLNYGDGTATGVKWGVSHTSKAAFLYKDRIDRAFVEKFRVLAAPGVLTPESAAMASSMVEMVCGGCAAKVAAGPLERALERLPGQIPDDRVLLGASTPDDVVSVQFGGKQLVANVDMFTAFTEDPWFVGRMAADNATSDLHAKGARPRYALAMVQVPDDRDPEEALFQVLSGARSTLDAGGVVLLGGHTTVGEKLAVGFTVFGDATKPLWPKGPPKLGDSLVLTRPLGTGVLWHADMAGRASGPDVSRMMALMKQGNVRASELLGSFQPTAVTDVTGFGLAGHLSEVMRGSGLAAHIELSEIPLLPGLSPLLDAGERSTFHENNREVIKAMHLEEAARVSLAEVLFDPQTSGPLLVSLPSEQAAGYLEALHAAGLGPAAIIGTVREGGADGAFASVSYSGTTPS